MASSATKPVPNANGYYSRVLSSRFEQTLIEEIESSAPREVDSSNAGELLFSIWTQAANVNRLPRPPELSTLQLCNDYVGRRPEMLSLLTMVQQQKAYAWLCEQFATLVPLNTSPSLPLEHTPNLSDEEFNRISRDFLDKCRPKMRYLVENADNIPSFLPSWIPNPPPDKDLAEHIANLRIPAVSGGRPSLLLHDLGEEKSNLDRDRTARIPDIFSFAYHTVLINTSGSGKTKLLLDGLCRRWGFYVVAKPDMAGIGSGDLWRIMEELDQAKDYQRAKEMREADEKVDSAIQHMREKRLAQLLLARFLLLNLLVEEAQPQIFGEDFNADIFTHLTRLLGETSISDLRRRISVEYSKLSGLRSKVLNPNTGKEDTPPFFCVLDEVQITSTKRPILREIWNMWTTVLANAKMRVVLSGTGIELKTLDDTLSSNAFKEQPYHRKTDVGAFEDPGTQAEYIKRYVPASWSDRRWMEFLTRVWAWLRGRYRCTATFISLILEAGYQCPHRTLDEYVHAFTDFMPTDGNDWTNQEPSHFDLKDLVRKLNFEKMDEMQASTLCDVIYDQMLYGSFTLSSFSSKSTDAFIEYGFARYKPGIKDAVIDEPLPILAALQWLYHNKTFSMFRCLSRDIEKHRTRKNGFEAYLAFYLRTVFQTAPKLDEIFTFRDDFARRGGSDLAWQHERFELVTVVHADAEDPQVFVVTPDCGPASNVGFLAKSGEEVLEWISTNRKKITFCFPPEGAGPDIGCVLRSKESGRLLFVWIQAKKYDDVDKCILIEGVRTVTPSWFWRSKHRKYAIADAAPLLKKDSATLVDNSHTTLANIPLGLKLEGADYPILRVFASWPGDAQLERTQEWKEPTTGNRTNIRNAQESSMDNTEDPDQHPLASLCLAKFNEVGEKLDNDWFGKDLEQKLVVHFKRPREEEDSDSLRLQKRAKLGTRVQSAPS